MVWHAQSQGVVNETAEYVKCRIDMSAESFGGLFVPGVAMNRDKSLGAESLSAIDSFPQANGDVLLPAQFGAEVSEGIV